MDQLVKKLAPFGIMGIVFIVALTSSMGAGLVGAAAFTAAMASIGPAGMIGGIVTLGVVGLVSSLAVEFGYDSIVFAVIREQLKTKSKKDILSEIEKDKFITKGLKLKIKDYVKKA